MIVSLNEMSMVVLSTSTMVGVSITWLPILKRQNTPMRVWESERTREEGGGRREERR